jgi:tRNA threonylcarbamoyladenosine biosynthesis protein TsaE
MSTDRVRKERGDTSASEDKGRRAGIARRSTAADEGPGGSPVFSASPDQTEELGRRLGKEARPGTVFCLFGELGAGKTKLTQGIARGLGVPGTYAVTSPTFTLVNEYPGRLPLIHIDLFRISSADELLDLGWEEYLQAEGVVVIEWAERAGPLLPESRVVVSITITGERERRFDFVSFPRS